MSNVVDINTLKARSTRAGGRATGGDTAERNQVAPVVLPAGSDMRGEAMARVRAERAANGHRLGHC